MPLKGKGGFQKRLSSGQCLTKEQTKHIYDKVESGEEVKIKKLVQHNTLISPNQNVNQYEKALLNDRNMRRNNS